MTKIRSLAKPSQPAGRIAIPIAGDDNAAKQTVTTLIKRIGFDVVDPAVYQIAIQHRRMDRCSYLLAMLIRFVLKCNTKGLTLGAKLYEIS